MPAASTASSQRPSHDRIVRVETPQLLPHLWWTLRKTIELIDPDKRWRWFALIFMSLTVSVMEAVGALLIFGLFSLSAGPGSVPELPLIGGLPWRPTADRTDTVLTFAVAVAVFFMLRGGLFVAQTYLQHRVANNTGVAISGRLFANYLAMPYALHLRRNSAELIRNAWDSVNAVARFVLVPVVEVASELLLICAMLAVLFVTAPLVTSVAVLFLGPLVAVIVRSIQAPLSVLGSTNQGMSRDTLQMLQQGLHGVKEVKLQGREDYFVAAFIQARAQLARSVYRQATLAAAPRAVLETAFVLAMLAFVVVTLATADSNASPLPLLALFGYAVLRLMPALNRVLISAGNLKYGAAAVQQVYADAASSVTRASRGTEPVGFDHSMDLDDLSFQYEGSSSPALAHIDLSIRKGESCGVVGPTGGGKTTLVDLITGLLEPSSGRVLVDGRDIRTNLAGWQRRIGMVPQNVYLVDDTLRRNVAFGLPDDRIDDEAVREAVAMAQLNAFVSGLADGVHTQVGERGVRLSGGQRQRIAIARALYRRPDVLIFDEGTSALDTLTERELIAALERLRGSHTLITVAHRLTTVRTCDRVIVIRDGAIAATGTFAELIETDAEFRRSTSD